MTAISSDFNSADTSADATALLAAVTRFEFIVALCIASDITGYLKGISAQLQGRQLDIAAGFSQVTLVQKKLQKVYYEWYIVLRFDLVSQL